MTDANLLLGGDEHEQGRGRSEGGGAKRVLNRHSGMRKHLASVLSNALGPSRQEAHSFKGNEFGSDCFEWEAGSGGALRALRIVNRFPMSNYDFQ